MNIVRGKKIILVCLLCRPKGVAIDEECKIIYRKPAFAWDTCLTNMLFPFNPAKIPAETGLWATLL